MLNCNTRLLKEMEEKKKSGQIQDDVILVGEVFQNMVIDFFKK